MNYLQTERDPAYKKSFRHNTYVDFYRRLTTLSNKYV